MKFLINSYGTAAGNPYVIISWWNSSNVYQGADIVFLTISDVETLGQAEAAVAAINTYASTNSLTVSSLSGMRSPHGLSLAPQSAITDCPADATTNYNTVTTLLGSVTGAVNTANTKQNQIATQLNSLLAELRTLGLIST